MNTMVGLQASLHTTVRENNMTDLMRDGRDPIAGDTGVDDDVFGGDDFDAEELLNSPLFNASTDRLSDSFANENSFGTFEEDMAEAKSSAPINKSQTICGGPSNNNNPAGALQYSEPEQQSNDSRVSSGPKVESFGAQQRQQQSLYPDNNGRSSSTSPTMTDSSQMGGGRSSPGPCSAEDCFGSVMMEDCSSMSMPPQPMPPQPVIASPKRIASLKQQPSPPATPNQSNMQQDRSQSPKKYQSPSARPQPQQIQSQLQSPNNNQSQSQQAQQIQSQIKSPSNNQQGNSFVAQNGPQHQQNMNFAGVQNQQQQMRQKMQNFSFVAGVQNQQQEIQNMMQQQQQNAQNMNFGGGAQVGQQQQQQQIQQNIQNMILGGVSSEQQQMQQNMNIGMQVQRSPPQKSSSFVSPRQRASFVAQTPQAAASFSGQGMPMPTTQQNASGLGSPVKNTSFQSSPQVNSFGTPNKANSFCAPNQNNSLSVRGQQASVPMQAQGSQGQIPQGGGPAQGNPLEQMQQFAQQMQGTGAQRAINNVGLSQTIHGQPMSDSRAMNNMGLSQTVHGQPMTMNNVGGLNQVAQGQPMAGSRAMNNAALSQTVHGEPSRRSSNPVVLQAMSQSLSQSVHERKNSFQGASNLTPPFGGVANNSIASEMPPNKGKGPAPLNNAMEKLCESMKRSAMSRTLIKQYSSRGSNLNKQNSFRGQIPRQNSGRMMIKQMSNRNVGEDGSGRGTPTAAVPIRRISNTKHHLQAPSRGVYRHDSQQSLNGQSNHGMNLHIDGRNMGPLG